MKKVIVRAPETDRKLLSIPDSVFDFDDYVVPVPFVPTYVHGTVYSNNSQGVFEFGVWDTLVLNSSSNVSGTTADGTGITINAGNAGLYLVIFRVKWELGDDSKFVRSLRIRKNGATTELEVPFAGYTMNPHTDTAACLLRLAANDALTLQAYVTQSVNMASTGDVMGEITSATLEVAWLAP